MGQQPAVELDDGPDGQDHGLEEVCEVGCASGHAGECEFGSQRETQVGSQDESRGESRGESHPVER